MVIKDYHKHPKQRDASAWNISPPTKSRFASPSFPWNREMPVRRLDK